MTDLKRHFLEFFGVLKRVFVYIFSNVLKRVPVFAYGQNHGSEDVFCNQDSQNHGSENVSGNQDSHMCELAQLLRSSPTVRIPSADIDGSKHLNETQPTELLMIDGCTELNRSQFVRLSRSFRESCSDLRDTQVKLLGDLCLVANRSEEFFLSVSKDLWLRTDLRYDSRELGSSNFPEEQCCALFSSTSTRDERCRLFSKIFAIHSTVVPRRPYWKRLRIPLCVVRGDQPANVASKYYPCTFLQAPLQGQSSVIEYFPSTFLKAPLEGNSLSIAKLLKEWKDRMPNEINDVGMSNIDKADEQKRPFWKVGPTDVDVNVGSQKRLGGGTDGEVWILSWRGGMFVRKEFFAEPKFRRELEVVRRVKTHPHIVYSFGVYDRSCLLMEKLERDLECLIADKVRLRGSEPPFSRHDSVDMLLQIAEAMAHLHEQGVVHGDLKSGNVLVSHCEIVGDVWHYIVKVADFGNATIVDPCKCTFEPADGTTGFAAPEVLQRRGKIPGSSERAMSVDFAKKSDVYSFAITAFQVLTGELETVRTKDVMAGVRPPLRKECSKKSFWYDKELIQLVEECWAQDPERRPSFSDVTVRLKSIYKNLQRSLRRQEMARRLAPVLIVAFLPVLLVLVQYICNHCQLTDRSSATVFGWFMFSSTSKSMHVGS